MSDYDPDAVRDLPVDEQARIARAIEYEVDELYDAHEKDAVPVPVIRREFGLNGRLGFWRWIPMLEVLASARAEPFLAEMGLSFLDPRATRSVARHAIERVDELNDGEEPEDEHALQEAVVAAVELLEEVLDRIEADQGTEVAERFRQYMLRGFPTLLRESRLEHDWRALFDWICPERVNTRTRIRHCPKRMSTLSERSFAGASTPASWCAPLLPSS